MYGSISLDDEESRESLSEEQPVPNAGHHRIIHRVGKFGQSTGNIFVRKRIKKSDMWAIYGTDWFHSLVDAPTWRVVAILVGAYVFIVAFFAYLYYQISTNYVCGMDIETYLESFDFSLETMATIGYSASDIYFDSCLSASLVLCLQMCVRLIVEGLTIGIVYCRLARPHSRASTIIFSDKAVIRRIRGKLYFMFQLCELRKHQLVEAHVRLYVVRKEVDRSGDYSHPYLQTSVMRLNHPNDELGSMLLLMLPQVVVHELDISSPLMPPPVWISISTGETISWDPPCYRNLRRQASAARNNGAYGPAFQNDEDDHMLGYGTVSAASGTPIQPRLQQRQYQQQSSPAKRRQGLPRLHQPSQQWEEEEGAEDEERGEWMQQTGKDWFPPLHLRNPEADRSATLFNPEALSSLEFPNVMRRGIVDSQHFFATNITRNMGSTAAAGVVPLQSLFGSPSLASAATISPLPRPPSSLSPTPLRSGIAEERLESPGLSRYCRDMQVGLRGGSFLPADSGKRLYSTPGKTPPPFLRPPQRTMSMVEDEAQWQAEEKKMVQKFMLDRQMEIIVVVEGIDSATGGNVQARQSYTCNEIEWDKSFEYCLYDDPVDQCTTIDFDSFHNLRDAPKDAAFPGPIPSCI